MNLEAVIGLEIHVQLNTRSKIFSSDPNIFGASPNSLISPISLGYPGTLPKLNEEAFKKAIVMGIACNCDINLKSEFSRKHYFYPDLPKGYQITQHEESICKNGFIDLDLEHEVKRIRLEKIHLEEDAGKSMHVDGEEHSVIDLNRAGVPLIEIVTKPDLSTAEEAFQLLIKIRKLVRYFDISDGDMEKGSLRCDANVSLKEEGSSNLRNKVEIKNLNSMRFVRQAIHLEIERQQNIYKKDGKVESHTRGYDDVNNITFPTRAKEMAHDYRYMPEPDLPPFKITTTVINEIRDEMPPLPELVSEQLIKQYRVNTEDADLLAYDKEMMDYFTNASIDGHNDIVLNWINGPIREYLNSKEISIGDFPIAAERLKGLIELILKGEINHNIASKKIFPLMFEKPDKSAQQLWGELNVEIKSDVTSLQQLIEEAVDKFPDKVEEYSKGKKGIVELFMGQVMKASRGTADPGLSRKLIIETLNNKNSKK